MDPFTQRMLERAKARREKLDTQLSNAGHDVKRRRSPLTDANAILAQVPDSVLKKSPSKTIENSQSQKSKTTRKFSPSKNTENCIKMNNELNKENGESETRSVRSKLQRLGKLYADDNRELSSPIHKNEEMFAIEDSKNKKSSKPCARLNRLAALASEINNWEDDLSHPTLIKPTVSKAERVQAKFNEQVKNNYDLQPSTSGNKNGSPLRPIKWEKSILETAENKDKIITENKSTSSSPVTSVYSNDSSQHLKTPEKSIKNCVSNIGSPLVSSTRMNSKFGYNCSAKSSLIQSPGSVLNKASIFESKGSMIKVKDPAEMTLSERKALFERNKGEALIPKAPLTMSVPTKMLQEKEKHSSNHSMETGRTMEIQRTIFEQVSCTQDLQNIQAERQRELEMLRSRFNRNRDIVQTAVSSSLHTSESSEGKSSSPKSSPICPVKPTTALEHPPPLPPPLPVNKTIKQNYSLINNKNAPPKRQVEFADTQNFEQPSTFKYVPSPAKSVTPKKVMDIKCMKVSPPKVGHFYSDLANIQSSSTETETEFTPGSTEAETATLDEPTDTETETEAEYYVQNKNYDHESSDENDDDIENTSLGRSILQVVNQQTVFNKKRSIDPDPDSTTSDISVLDEMDEYLDEYLAFQEAGEEGPTPAKLNKGGKSVSDASHSFKYTQGNTYRSPIKIISPTSLPTTTDHYILEGDSCVPLMHSISLYRKQQSQIPKTPTRLVSRIPEITDTIPCNLSDDKETILVQDKIKQLLEDIQKQQTIIGQASQALNLCNSTIEFNGSREQVEGERLLLLANHRRQAALNEVQRLKVEGSIKPVVPGAPEVQESGSLTISAITLPLKRDFFRHIEPETCLHFVCLVRHLETVIATPVVQVEPGDSCLRFPSTLKVLNLFSDFKLTIEVYSLQTRAEILPHEIKYHIHNSGSNCSNFSSNNKKNGIKTPKKFLKQENKLIMPHIQSPAGSSAIQTSFSLAGYVIFSLKEVHRQQFTLNKVPFSSPLEGRLQMHVSCELTVSVDYHGFLTMFEDISGFGAWHRRWCLLKGATLCYWKYPDDERKKTPIGSLDLQSVTTTNVNLVSRDICARPHTFLLETSRPMQFGDIESLIMVRNGSTITIRHLLSADTKEDRLEWCSKLNKTLHLIRAWKGTSS